MTASTSTSSSRKRKASGTFPGSGKKAKVPGLLLTDLPEVPILVIASHLGGSELLKFSHLCRKFFEICNRSSSLWKDALKMDGLTFSKVVRRRISTRPEVTGSEPEMNVEKLSYLEHLRVKSNWSAGNICKEVTLPALIGHPGRFKGIINLETRLPLFCPGIEIRTHIAGTQANGTTYTA